MNKWQNKQRIKAIKQTQRQARETEKTAKLKAKLRERSLALQLAEKSQAKPIDAVYVSGFVKTMMQAQQEVGRQMLPAVQKAAEAMAKVGEVLYENGIPKGIVTQVMDDGSNKFTVVSAPYGPSQLYAAYGDYYNREESARYLCKTTPLDISQSREIINLFQGQEDWNIDRIRSMVNQLSTIGYDFYQTFNYLQGMVYANKKPYTRPVTTDGFGQVEPEKPKERGAQFCARRDEDRPVDFDYEE